VSHDLAETSVLKSRPSVPYGANLFTSLFHSLMTLKCSSLALKAVIQWVQEVNYLCVCVVMQMQKKVNKDKPLLRRKSELPHDNSTLRALENHKRPEPFLTIAKESG